MNLKLQQDIWAIREMLDESTSTPTDDPSPFSSAASKHIDFPVIYGNGTAGLVHMCRRVYIDTVIIITTTMDAKQFAKAYPYDLSSKTIHGGDHSEYIKEAQEWSYRFGRRLHSDLTDTTPDNPVHPVDDLGYWRWIDGLNDLESQLIVSGESGLQGLNEINFHRMNFCMRSVWNAVRDHGWRSEGDRLHRMGAAERMLARTGLDYYIVHSTSSPDALFEGELRGIHASMVGILQEFDSALLLLRVIRKHRNLTVVPAPLNFERVRKAVNVDFVVADCDNQRAVGIQVKTKVRDYDFENSDKERVVFIDGSVDLNNVKAMRTKRRSSSVQVVPWPGMFIAKAVDLMKPDQFGVHINSFSKKWANTLLGDVKVDFRGAEDIIEERVLQKL